MLVKRTTDFLNGSFRPMRSTSLLWNKLLNIMIMTEQKHVESESSSFLSLSHQTPCIFDSRISFLSCFLIIKEVGSSRLMFSSEIILNILTKCTRGKQRKLIMRMEGNHSHNLSQVKMTLRTLPAERIYQRVGQWVSKKSKEREVVILVTVVTVVIVVMKVIDIDVVSKEAASPRVLPKVKTTQRRRSQPNY